MIKTSGVKCWRGDEAITTLHSAGGCAKQHNQFGNCQAGFFKLNIHLDYYPEIPLLGIYPREIRNGHKNSHMQISLTALCTVVQKLEIATVTINRQMYKQAYYICAMEYC
jgi:hypothetical protein